MNKKRAFILGIIVATVFLMIGIKISSNQVTIKSRDGNIVIKHDKVKEYNYLNVRDQTNPTPKMYKEHLEDAMVYVLTHDDYDRVYDFYGNIEFGVGVEDEALVKYLKYLKNCDEFKEIGPMLSYSSEEDVLEHIIKLLDRSMKYNGL